MDLDNSTLNKWEYNELHDHHIWKDYYAKMLVSSDIAYLLHGKYDHHLKHKKTLIVDFNSINDWQKNVWWDWLHPYTREWVLNECAEQQLDYFVVLRKTIDHTILHDPSSLFALTSIILRNLPVSVNTQEKCFLMENIEMVYYQSGYLFSDEQKLTLQTMIFKTHIDRSSLTFFSIKDNKDQTLSIVESNILFLSNEYKKLTNKTLMFMHWFALKEDVLNNLLCYILYLSDLFPKRSYRINDIAAVLKLFNKYFETTIPMGIAMDRWNYNFINHYRIV